ncbi:MAG TPA: acetyl-CoA carboxylase carboxyltransferase subunit alpha [Candidatus Acidoferrales bacterium]|nr:acetyl-CoA carboxylase carboxyltransferase subunit alpha [Candidatus Acidoferrales bacterium]
MKTKRQLARERLERMRKRAEERRQVEGNSGQDHGQLPAGNHTQPSGKPAASGSRTTTRNGSVHSISEKKSHGRISAPATHDPETTSVIKQEQRQIEIEALERDVAELSRLTDPSDATSEEIERIRREVEELKHEFYAHLGVWQRLQVARHPQRPYTEDFIRILFENFSELHGDRFFADDPALLTGMAWYHGRPVLVIGSQKGRDTKQRLARNFGQAKPEGYRKALRAMNLAAKFRRPIIVFVDTPGAYPGVDAEERGQAEAIAHNLREMSRLPVPIIVTITGEGGSGGALATAVGDRVFMLENSVYSVISPEGCASIMWRDATKAETAAEALKITAQDLLGMKLIDAIVPEPEGGAHMDHVATARLLDPVLSSALAEASALPVPQLLAQRYEKFRRMGQFFA